MRRGVHDALPAAEGRCAPRHRRSQRHPARSACPAAGQSAPAARATAASSTPARAWPQIERPGSSWTVTTEAGRQLLRADPRQCRRGRGPIGSRSLPAFSRSASSRSGERSSPSTRRREPTLDGLPFAKTVGDELYFAPESGRLFASPMDEVPSEPCDAQPDEYEVALAAHRMEERTIVKVERIHSRWAGLRTFTPDRHPAVGFAPDAEGFFWLAGQGGFGLQTSPAMAAIVDSLIARDPWPVAGCQRRGAKSRPLPPADGIGRPSARRRDRTGGRSAPRPTC